MKSRICLSSLVLVTFLFHSVSGTDRKPRKWNVGGILNVRGRSEDNALEIEIPTIAEPWTRGILGISLPSAVGSWTNCASQANESFCAQWGDFANVKIQPGKDPNRCIQVEWTSLHARELEDCYNIDPMVHWYGGAQTYHQVWPIETLPKSEGPYVTGLVNEYAGVVENYWLLSSGAALIIHPETPLFFSLNTTHPDKVCFTARDEPPYTRRSPLTLKYEWCVGADVKDTHQHALSTYFDKPTGMPDENMMIQPFWSTWAEFKVNINQSIVMDFARRVISEGFVNSSHIEIDDHWEVCYGQESFDPEKFPNVNEMMEEIKGMNMKVTMWLHPFVNYECPLFKEGFDKGYFVKTPHGKTGITSWWQGGNAGIIDVTNPEAAQWWTERLARLQQETGIDSFKFDAGETNWLPSAPAFYSDNDQDTSKLWPQLYSTKYAETVAAFGGLIETRAVRLNQNLPVFVRMYDRWTEWGYDNGLKTVIPTVLQFGISGYPFVLPDMIGGNSDHMPSKELYVRWVQANIFMPAVQFSKVPWKYDAETIEICLDVLATREKFREHILAAARQAVADGSPINRPIWWVAPNDPETYTIDNAYMLGDTILVAPVLDEGATSRDIYLPIGNWAFGGNSSEVHTGPVWLRDYPAPLNIVPFFIKTN